MAFNWIKPEEYSFNTFLLMDKWIIQYFLGLNKNSQGYYVNDEYRRHLGIALYYNPVVQWYFKEKCPEGKERIEELINGVSQNLSPKEIRESEMYILDKEDSFVVYAYPKVMERLDYVKHWKPERLLGMVDFTDKVVLDIGSGTGRLAFAAAQKAKYVYAIDPVDRLREYLRDEKEKIGIENIRISEGTIEEIPYPDDTFDIVMSGHVMGDNLNKEMNEMARVVKNGGYIIDCIGEDDRKRELNKDMIQLGFEHTYYKSILGGDIYNYWKKIEK
jgi:2-polyprenyl-3-methyl-5-hydroxy-6-metoxy-1,4-benzoquinol methylase